MPPQQQWGTPYPPQQMAAPYAPPPPPQQGTPIGTYLMGGLIVSVVAGLLILFAPFSGFYVGGSIYIYSWVLEGLPLLMPLGIVFMVIAYYASQGMRDPRQNTAQQLGKLRNYAVGAMAWVFIDGVIFIAIMVSYDYEWWFEAGFYGGAIGSIIAVVCFQMAVSQAAPATHPAQGAWPPPGQPPSYQYPPYSPPPPQAAPPSAQYPTPQQPQQWWGQQPPPQPPRR
jgi:hypothetical protein